MISVEEAQQRVLDLISPLDTEEVSFTGAHDRVLREDVVAPRDVPQGDNTAMDGYAVRAEDLPGTLRVIDDLPAGSVPRVRLEPQTAIRIMTGALIPDGADTVAHVEITDGGREMVRIDESLPRGTNIRRRGEDMRAGDVVMRKGTLIRAGEIGVLAGVQKMRVAVAKQPTIAILSTGDELVDVGEMQSSGKVVNSNSYSLAALARETGAIPRLCGIVRDDRDATIAALEAALDATFVITTGGVSAGAYDFVKDALEALGAETKFWKVAMKPGKPVVVSTLRDRVIFGLPGNPVSCMVAFHLFVAPAIRKAMGASTILPPIVRARLAAPIKSKGDRRAYMRVHVAAENGELVAHPMRAQGSGVSTSMIGANAFAIVSEGLAQVEQGEMVETLLFGTV
jgi:molybdopterin molybdotransferase